MKWLWSLIKKFLLKDVQLEALQKQAYERGKLEAINEQQKAEIAAAQSRNDISSDVDGMSDADVAKRLRTTYQADW